MKKSRGKSNIQIRYRRKSRFASKDKEVTLRRRRGICTSRDRRNGPARKIIAIVATDCFRAKPGRWRNGYEKPGREIGQGNKKSNASGIRLRGGCALPLRLWPPIYSVRIRRMGTGSPPTAVSGEVPSPDPLPLEQPMTFKMTTLIRSL